MEELTPLVTKICVLQQKAPLEVSKEKRQLLELLEKRHRRYVEKKGCEALELESLPSRDQLSDDGGLDKGLVSFTEHIVQRAQERRMKRRRHRTSLNPLPQSLVQSTIATSPHKQAKGKTMGLVGSYDSRQQPCFPKPAWQSPQTKLPAEEQVPSPRSHCYKLRRSCKSASLPHLATPVKEHIRELCRTTLKQTPQVAAVPCHSPKEQTSEESTRASRTSAMKVKRNLFSVGDGCGRSRHSDASCGSGAVGGSAEVPTGLSSSWSRKEVGESQRKTCAVVYLSERHSHLCPVTHVPMVPPVTPEPGQADNVRYIQALHDCKSQRALKALLKAIEGKRAGDVQKAEMARVAAEMEKQVDSIARIKAQQRMEIYALNAEMCKLEEANYKAMKDAKV